MAWKGDDGSGGVQKCTGCHLQSLYVFFHIGDAGHRRRYLWRCCATASSANPPITRVVLDLTAPIDYRVSPVANRIVVKLGNQAGLASEPVAPTTNPTADATPPETPPAETPPAASTPPPPQSSEPSFLHWVMPILVVSAVMAMRFFAVVVHLQNKGAGRGF